MGEVKLSARHLGALFVIGGAIGFQNYSCAFLTVGRERSRVFTKEFMEERFGEQHKYYMGRDTTAHALGYPDMGAGPYSKALPYRDWFRFNCA